jgi:N-hydroxyarylamine O-acetyltransferase
MRPFDVDAYLQRIACTVPRSTSLDTLAAVHLAHTQSIPFENLNPLLRLPVKLDAGALANKLVEGARGGYCYEHNLLLAQALHALGFNVLQLAARVSWNVPEHVVRPRTHMLLLVALGAHHYVVDAGFGGLTLTAPLRLDRRVPQATPHGAFRLQRTGGDYMLQAQLSGAWQSLYRFDLQPQHLSDYEMASWYLCHHRESLFRNHLVAALPHPAGRYALLDNLFTSYAADGAATRQELSTVAELRDVLVSRFGVELQGLPELDAQLARLVQGRAG